MSGFSPVSSPTKQGDSLYPRPVVKGRHGRYCPYCQMIIHNYRHREKCPSRLCDKEIPKPPPLPAGYSWCPCCIVGYYQVDWHNCHVCAQLSPKGQRQEKVKREFEADKRQLEKDFNKRMQELDIPSPKRQSLEIPLVTGTCSSNSHKGKETTDEEHSTNDGIIGKKGGNSSPSKEFENEIMDEDMDDLLSNIDTSGDAQDQSLKDVDVDTSQDQSLKDPDTSQSGNSSLLKSSTEAVRIPDRQNLLRKGKKQQPKKTQKKVKKIPRKQ